MITLIISEGDIPSAESREACVRIKQIIILGVGVKHMSEISSNDLNSRLLLLPQKTYHHDAKQSHGR